MSRIIVSWLTTVGAEEGEKEKVWCGAERGPGPSLWSLCLLSQPLQGRSWSQFEALDLLYVSKKYRGEVMTLRHARRIAMCSMIHRHRSSTSECVFERT